MVDATSLRFIYVVSSVMGFQWQNYIAPNFKMTEGEKQYMDGRQQTFSRALEYIKVNSFHWEQAS